MLADILAPFVGVRPVQIQKDIAALRIAEVNRFFDEGAICFAFVVLVWSFAEPAVLRQRQANDIDVPVINCDSYCLNDMTRRRRW